MATKIHSKTYISGYHSVRDLNENGTMRAALHQEDKTLKNAHYVDALLARPAPNGYLRYEKEHLRQTILKHESIFKNQLQELHRLYRRQRDMMNEFNRSNVLKYVMPKETSQSCFMSSHIPSDDGKMSWSVSKFSPFGSTSCRPSALGTDIDQSPVNFLNGKRTPGYFPSQDNVRLKEAESHKSRGDTSQRRIFDLQLPADAFGSHQEEEQEEKVCALSGRESSCLQRNHGDLYDRDVNPSRGYGLNPDCDGDALASDPYQKRTHDVTNLNERIQMEEASVSASDDNLENITCAQGETQRHNTSVSANSGFHFLSSAFSPIPAVARTRGLDLNNFDSESDRNVKRQLTYNSKAEKSRCYDHSSSQGACSDDLSRLSKSSQVEAKKAQEAIKHSESDHGAAEARKRRTIFGVEICEENRDQSILSSCRPYVCRNRPQFDFTSSSTLAQNEIYVQENSSATIVNPSNRNFNLLMQSPEFLGEKMLLSCCPRQIPNLRVEAPNQKDCPCLDSQSDVKKFQSFGSSSGFDFASGTSTSSLISGQYVQHDPAKYFSDSHCTDMKYGKELTINMLNPYGFQKGAVPWQNNVSASELRKNDNLSRDWPLLTDKTRTSQQAKGRESSYQMNLDSLLSCSQKFFKKTEMAKNHSQITCIKIEADDCPSSKKILGVPIFEVPQIPKTKNSSPPCSPSKCAYLASDIQGNNNRKGLAGETKCGNQLEMKEFITDKGLNNYMIDLNLSLNEDEVSSAPSLPETIMKIAAKEIDLEAPAVFESEIDISCEADLPENQLKLPSEQVLDESGQHQEELVRVAAEAIIAISSCGGHQTVDNANCWPLQASPSDCLLWLADVVVSYKGDFESKVSEVLESADFNCVGECIPNGMDYFELMTLKLKDIKEEYCYNPAVHENQKDEANEVISLTKKPQKGKARRGRQRKDFQSDILPGLVSLSRCEVTEDLQTIEELFKASGCIWQSGMWSRRRAKNGRGRRRLDNSGIPQPETAVCPLPIPQLSSCRELGCEERIGLTGWGKRTRRMPRQRCPAENPAVALNC